MRAESGFSFRRARPVRWSGFASFIALLIVASGALAQTPEQRLLALGITLPEAPAPVANYVRAVTTGNLVFLAGHIPRGADGEVVRGKLGSVLDVEQGQQAARLSAIALLASLKAEIGSLDRVTRIVKVTGMVNSTPGFVEQSSVINGCSDLLVEVFGERGKHARAAVGMASLPLGAAVEIEMIVEIDG
jgi:enamine deaminase RidA (YjgF/YER057c/UK114 family)